MGAPCLVLLLPVKVVNYTKHFSVPYNLRKEGLKFDQELSGHRDRVFDAGACMSYEEGTVFTFWR